MNQVKLGEIAKFLRSKNAGPFKLTLDVFFHKREDYEKVKATGIINKQLISDLYQFENKQKISIFEFDQASAIKITLPRDVPSGNVGDSDIYGAQQHAPLYDVLIPWE